MQIESSLDTIATAFACVVMVRAAAPLRKSSSRVLGKVVCPDAFVGPKSNPKHTYNVKFEIDNGRRYAAI